MLPGDESMFSVEMVCIESMMTRSGAVFLMFVKICSSDVSHAISRLFASGMGDTVGAQFQLPCAFFARDIQHLLVREAEHCLKYQR